MGRNSQRRRADKKRRGHAGPTNKRPAANPAVGDSDASRRAEALVSLAADLAEAGDDLHVEELVQLLIEMGGHTGTGTGTGTGSTLAGWVLAGELEFAVRAAWAGGWQPSDVVRAAAKRLGESHAGLVVVAIASEARRSAGPGTAVPERWQAQLRDIGATVWWNTGTGNFVDHWATRDRLDPHEAVTVGVELVGMLIHLPILPHLIPPPTEWAAATRGSSPGAQAPGVDGRVLTKVRALLAKAESTTFDDEAEALTAKAQELMARYAIDQAMLHGSDPSDKPTGHRVGIDDPYAAAKATLLAVVASANRCRTVSSEGYGFCSVIGFAVDMEIVEVLYTSLLVQATRAMTAAGSVRDGSGRSRTRSFRQSFLVSFATRIGERLREASASATDQAGEVHGASLLPVLAGREAEVEDAVSEAFPHTVRRNLAVTNYSGWIAGRAAADLARLGPEQELVPGNQR
jgi:hypothetical protein